MRVMWFECKKILYSKVNLILLVIFTAFIIWSFHSTVESHHTDTCEVGFHDSDGSLMNCGDVLKEISREKVKWTGPMNQEWWTRLEKAVAKAEKNWDYQVYDTEKMRQVYGEDWYEDLKAHEEDYTDSTDIEGIKEGKKPYYSNEELVFTKSNIHDEVITSLYMNYGKTMMVNRPWNEDSGTFGTMYSGYNNEQVASSVYSTPVEKEEIQLMKKSMNEKGNFHYGDSKSWFDFLNTMSMGGLLLLVWVLLISSNLINKERKNQMMEVISSCTRSRSYLFFSKHVGAILAGFIGMAVMNGSLFLYAQFSGLLGDPNVNITESLNLISVFTYGEAFILSLAVMVLGILVCAVVGTFCSTFLKSSYRSFAVTAILLLLPTMLFPRASGVIAKLMPENFMIIENVTIRTYTIMLGGNAYFLWKILPLIWMPVCILLVLISWFWYRRPSYQRI